MNFKNLLSWKLGIELVTEVYEATSKFPKSECYGLTQQIRRSAVSIPSNIAEGAARNSDKEFAQFLHIALGSIAELETQFIIAAKIKYLENPESLFSKIQETRLMILGLIQSVKRRI